MRGDIAVIKLPWRGEFKHGPSLRSACTRMLIHISSEAPKPQ